MHLPRYCPCAAAVKGVGLKGSFSGTERALSWHLDKYSYLIVYRPETDPMQVVAILHGRRDIERLLRERPEHRTDPSPRAVFQVGLFTPTSKAASRMFEFFHGADQQRPHTQGVRECRAATRRGQR